MSVALQMVRIAAESGAKARSGIGQVIRALPRPVMADIWAWRAGYLPCAPAKRLGRAVPRITALAFTLALARICAYRQGHE